MKKTPKSILALFLITILFSAQAVSVYACGVSIIRSSSSGWTYGNDSAEQSFINYEKGIEHLIISRTFENGSANTVWVIPIPSTPTSINVDVISQIPQFSGYDVFERAKSGISDINNALLSTQIYPIAPLLFSETGYFSMARGGIMSGALPGAVSDITVYEHIEKNGMTAEVLSATNSDAIYKYFKDKGLSIQKDSVSILQGYIGKNFSFVATWISSSTQKVQAKGVLMQFPADKIFYPLKPGSVYPGKGLPETITVVGHVTPNLYENIRGATYVDYYHSYDNFTSQVQGFFSERGDFDYTRIVVNVPPKNMTEDLYISSKAPTKVVIASLVSKYSFILFLIINLIFSLIAAWMASILLYSEKVGSRAIKMGIAGFFTLIGTIIGARFLLQEKKWKFIALQSIIFTLLAVLWISLLGYFGLS